MRSTGLYFDVRWAAASLTVPTPGHSKFYLLAPESGESSCGVPLQLLMTSVLASRSRFPYRRQPYWRRLGVSGKRTCCFIFNSSIHTYGTMYYLSTEYLSRYLVGMSNIRTGEILKR